MCPVPRLLAHGRLGGTHRTRRCYSPASPPAARPAPRLADATAPCPRSVRHLHSFPVTRKAACAVASGPRGSVLPHPGVASVRKRRPGWSSQSAAAPPTPSRRSTLDGRRRHVSHSSMRAALAPPLHRADVRRAEVHRPVCPRQLHAHHGLLSASHLDTVSVAYLGFE